MKCTKCGSDNIKFVEDKKPWCYSFKVKMIVYAVFALLIVLCIGLLFVNFLCAVIVFFVSFGIFGIILKIMLDYQDSMRNHTRTKCICKECGNIWYLD